MGHTYKDLTDGFSEDVKVRNQVLCTQSAAVRVSHISTYSQSKNVSTTLTGKSQLYHWLKTLGIIWQLLYCCCYMWVYSSVTTYPQTDTEVFNTGLCNWLHINGNNATYLKFILHICKKIIGVNEGTTEFPAQNTTEWGVLL